MGDDAGAERCGNKNSLMNTVAARKFCSWRSWGTGVAVSKFSLLWFGSGLLSILFPLVVFGVARIRLHSEQAQEEGGDDGAGVQGYNNCRWWQWGCRTTYWDRDGNQEQDQQQQQQQRDENLPWWYFFADEETRRRREESGSNNPSLVFVYVWSLSLFLAILYFGHRELKNGSDLYRVVACLAVFANLAFLSLFLIGGLDGIQTNGRELEEQGFYAQFPVLMFITNVCWMAFTLAFAIFFTVQARRSGVTKIVFEQSDYQMHEPPDEEEAAEKKPVAA
jgi:hypothetical protein